MYTFNDIVKYNKSNKWLKFHGFNMTRRCGEKRRMSETEKINIPFRISRKADRKDKRKLLML